MKILGISDIHDNLPAVRKLRSREANLYDVVVVAGDIGNKNAAKIFEVLATYECPIVYVYGNWDDKLRYDAKLAPRGLHLDLKVYRVGDFNFVGFSGHRVNWGRNPMFQAHLKNAKKQATAIDRKIIEVEKQKLASEQIAGRRHNQARAKLQRKMGRLKLRKQELESKLLWNVDQEIEIQQRRALYELLVGLGDEIKHTIVITHERLWRFHEQICGVPLFLFGHTHSFQDAVYKGFRFINVAALGEVSWIYKSEESEYTYGFNAGSYVTLEVSTDGQISVESKNLGPIPPGFVDSEATLDGKYEVHPMESVFH